MVTFMTTHQQSHTPEMLVTSIRLEAELRQRLKELSGHQGYQALIRDVLWNYVQQSSLKPLLSPSDIRATIAAVAGREERCALTGQIIRPSEKMWLGLTTDGELVPLSFDWHS